VQDKVKGIVASGQLGIFSHGYWGHPAMRLSPELNLILFSHYLQALEFQRKSCQVVAILGGKTPHIQNLAVGGVMNAINLDSLATMNMDRLGMLKSLLEDLIPFVQQVFLVDACLLAASYPEWFQYGRGVANYLALPDLPLDAQATKFDLPGGVIMNGNLASVRPIVNWKDEAFPQGCDRRFHPRLVSRWRPAAAVQRREHSRLHRLPGGEEVHLGQSSAL
jgi:hydrogenase large subunit